MTAPTIQGATHSYSADPVRAHIHHGKFSRRHLIPRDSITIAPVCQSVISFHAVIAISICVHLQEGACAFTRAIGVTKARRSAIDAHSASATSGRGHCLERPSWRCSLPIGIAAKASQQSERIESASIAMPHGHLHVTARHLSVDLGLEHLLEGVRHKKLIRAENRPREVAQRSGGHVSKKHDTGCLGL